MVGRCKSVIDGFQVTTPLHVTRFFSLADDLYYATHFLNYRIVYKLSLVFLLNSNSSNSNSYFSYNTNNGYLGRSGVKCQSDIHLFFPCFPR